MSMYDEIRAQFDAIKPFLKRHGDHVRVNNLAQLQEHVEQRGGIDDAIGKLFNPSRSDVPLALAGMPVIVDATCEPGFLEVRDGDRVLERIRIA